MPRIGLRTMKTAFAAAIVMVINIILNLISPVAATRFYSPFFAAIAAVYSLQRGNSASFRLARIRSLGSVIGGLFGMALVLLYETLLLDGITETFGSTGDLVALYMLTSLFMVPLIHLMVLTKKTELVFIALLTYLSVTISVRNQLPVAQFAANRILSTIVGAMVALLVNRVHLHRRRNTGLLFVSTLDGCLLTAGKTLTPYTVYTLTSLIEDGLNFTVSTIRTPASVQRIFQDLHLKQEIMVMNGAVTYDMASGWYIDIKTIPKESQEGIDSYFSKMGRNIFIHTITDLVLTIHHTGFENDAERTFHHDRRNDMLRNHVKGKPAVTEDVVFYILIDKEETVEAYEKDLCSMPFAHEISMHVYPYDLYQGYRFLRIHASKTSKETALKSFLTIRLSGFFFCLAVIRPLRNACPPRA
jgi:hydroxymethylpyrimidine pyrophosphatase-like HAD family hydrolase